MLIRISPYKKRNKDIGDIRYNNALGKKNLPREEIKEIKKNCAKEI